MTELTISAPVGAPRAPNNPNDVRTVQQLLQGVQPPLNIAVAVTGQVDAVTLRAIREFQRRFMNNPDGIVNPDGRTLMHLNDHLSPSYPGCSPRQRVAIDRDVIDAQKWLDVVNRRLLNRADADMQRKVGNIFHIDVQSSAGAHRYGDLRQRFSRLRASLDENFPRRCEPGPSLFAAWVVLGDSTGTMHFPSNYVSLVRDSRIQTIIHERAHTVFAISHAGMVGAGAIDFGLSADDDNGFTPDQAVANAYCYGWLATALQPTYVPSGGGETIVVPRPRK